MNYFFLYMCWALFTLMKLISVSLAKPKLFTE